MEEEPRTQKRELDTKTRAGHKNALRGEYSRERAGWNQSEETRLVAEAGGDGDLVATLGAAAVEDGGSGLGGHANEKAVNLATAATVRLEGALGHRVCPVSNVVCWPYAGVAGKAASCQAVGTGAAMKANSTASLEYIRVEENRQRNSKVSRVGTA